MHGESLTVAEAAEQLGVSEKTIRRWVKVGRLSASLEHGPYGAQYRIPADALQAARQALAVVTVERRGDSQTLALAIVQALESRDDGLRAELVALREQVASLTEAIEQRLPAAPASQNAAQASILTAEAPDPTTEPSDLPAEPQPTPVPEPISPRPNGSGLWGRITAWLMA